MEIDIKEGDLIIAGSDGLFDNVYLNTIENLVNKQIKKTPYKKPHLKKIADRLAQEAYHNSLNVNFHSPFAKEAKENNQLFEGGKSDDITVLVAEITAN